MSSDFKSVQQSSQIAHQGLRASEQNSATAQTSYKGRAWVHNSAAKSPLAAATMSISLPTPPKIAGKSKPMTARQKRGSKSEKENTKAARKAARAMKKQGGIRTVQDVKQSRRRHYKSSYEAHIEREAAMRALRSMAIKGNAQSDKLLSWALKTTDGDPTAAYALMNNMALEFSESTDAQDKGLCLELDVAASDFYDDHGPSIQIGLNFPNIPKTKLDLLRDTVLSENKPQSEIFGELMRYEGAANFEKTVKFVMTALDKDSSMTDPAVDPQQLRALQVGVMTLSTCSGLEEQCARLIDQLNAGYRNPPPAA